MNEKVRELQPTALWNHFTDLNAVPRPSKKEEKVIQFIKSYGEKLGLSVLVDEAGNVIISKPATKGMETKTPVILQSHLDMVHQKNSDTKFDFATQGIEMIVEGDWVRAAGTTLGADNGIGVAAIMSILESKDLPHPPLEALFTIDEETGMTGALALKGGVLKGKILLNLDTEDDTEITIGCAGGLDVTASGTYEQVAAHNTVALKVSVKGLTGGHSGMDIHLGRGNANKLMNRLLYSLVNDYNIEVAAIEGGSLRNAIPRESVAIITVAEKNAAGAKAAITEYTKIIQKEYHTTDPSVTITIEENALPQQVLEKKFITAFIKSIYACPNGIYRMSPDIKGLVQTSNNVARVQVKEGQFQVQCLSRSSVDSEKTDLQQAIFSAFELCGAEVACAGGYPGWAPDPSAPILKLMKDLYSERFKQEAHVSAVHAGLECGILGRNYPGMQMISFGPNIRGAHSPEEKVQISSVQKFWGFLLDILQRIPEGNR